MTTDTLHGFINADGTMQVESNDRQLRILLKRSMVLEEGRQFLFYYSVYYVKDGYEWQKTTNSANYKSADEFLAAIRNAEDFTLAVRDIEEQKKGERAGG